MKHLNFDLSSLRSSYHNWNYPLERISRHVTEQTAEVRNSQRDNDERNKQSLSRNWISRIINRVSKQVTQHETREE